MTDAGQAFLFAGGFFCLLSAGIAMIYYAERLRSDFLRSLHEPSGHQHFRRQQ
jgi:hypothetical protein